MPDVWGRVWLWMEFMDDFIDVLPFGFQVGGEQILHALGMEPKAYASMTSLILSAGKLVEPPFEFPMDDRREVWFLLARAWRQLLDVNNAAALSDIVTILAEARIGSTESHFALEGLLNGAEGWDELADTIIGQLRSACHPYRSIAGLAGILIQSFTSYRSLRDALRRRGYSEAILQFTASLPTNTLLLQQSTVLTPLQSILTLVARIVAVACTFQIPHNQVPGLLRSGLLRVVLIFAGMEEILEATADVDRILHTLEALTLVQSVVVQLRASMEELTDPFPNTHLDLRDHWDALKQIVHERTRTRESGASGPSRIYICQSVFAVNLEFRKSGGPPVRAPRHVNGRITDVTPGTPTTLFTTAMTPTTPTAAQCPHPLCDRTLEEETGPPGSRFAGQRVYKCTNPVHPLFCYAVPIAAAPAAEAIAPAPTPIPASAPVSTQAPTAPLCSYPFAKCTNGRVHGLCSHGMCRKHCALTGPCKYKPHDEHRLRKLAEGQPSATTASNASASLPPSTPAPAPAIVHAAATPGESVFDFGVFDAWQNHFSRAPHVGADPIFPVALHQNELQSNAADCSFDITDEALNAAYEHAVNTNNLPLPAEQNPFSFPTPTSTSLNIATAPIASTTPEMSTAIASPVAPAAPLLPPSSQPRRPVQRAAAPSARPGRRTVAPKLTSQLNGPWTAAAARADAAPSPSAHSAASAPMAPRPTAGSSILHVRRKKKERSETEARRVERFTVAYMDGGRTPHMSNVDFITLKDVQWPYYQLGKDPDTVQRLGITLDNLEMYDPKFGMFVGIQASWVHTVHTDSVLLLRRAGTSNPADDENIQKIVVGTVSPHLRHRQPQERVAVRAALLADTDDDIPTTPTPGKRFRSPSSPTSTSPASRRQHQLARCSPCLSCISGPLFAFTSTVITVTPFVAIIAVVSFAEFGRRVYVHQRWLLV
ncbi:hypothetical protein HMN09_01174600 [Mycena chlorophos]|uniref:Uncharacterized protein n=1 Tax=Mycena chlorophos TaxID=658473 RepID=A0A8H6VTX1_MYCCL|nr:hypothetical protein HMN09_01174600 [Mycena chlorophos]